MKFDPIEKFETIDADMVAKIARMLGSVGAIVAGMPDVNCDAGAGVVRRDRKCLWTNSGHRVTIEAFADGGWIASKSKEPDPEYKADRFK